jgi:hypothetical protein
MWKMEIYQIRFQARRLPTPLSGIYLSYPRPENQIYPISTNAELVLKQGVGIAGTRMTQLEPE